MSVSYTNLCAPSYLSVSEAAYVPTIIDTSADDELNSIEGSLPVFKAYPKTPRLESETITISEKVDGTNGVLYVHKARFGDIKTGTDMSYVLAGSRSKWLMNDGRKSWDNHGFGAWVKANEEELFKLPEGYHYGEWYGRGINSGYGMKDRKFMLFNWKRYENLEDLPKCVELETVLADNIAINELSARIKDIKREAYMNGSWHVPGATVVEGLILRFKLSAKVYKEVWYKS